MKILFGTITAAVCLEDLSRCISVVVTLCFGTTLVDVNYNNNYYSCDNRTKFSRVPLLPYYTFIHTHTRTYMYNIHRYNIRFSETTPSIRNTIKTHVGTYLYYIITYKCICAVFIQNALRTNTIGTHSSYPLILKLYEL